MAKSKHRYGIRAGWLAIAGNIVLFGLKYWAGIVSGSVALLADAWHTLSDSVSSIVLLVFYKAANKPPDREHPYGHGRFRLVASIIIGVILALIAVNFGKEAIHKLIHHESVEFGTLAIVVTALSILVKEGMAQYALFASRKSGSLSVKADAWHHRSDAISSLVILLGIFLNPFAWWVDGILGLIVAVLIFYTAFKIVREAINRILGETPDSKLIQEIKELSNTTAGFDVQSHNFRLHSYGDHKELTFHIRCPGNRRISDVSRTVRSIRQKIRKDLDIEPTIQVDMREYDTD